MCFKTKGTYNNFTIDLIDLNYSEALGNTLLLTNYYYTKDEKLFMTAPVTFLQKSPEDTKVTLD